MSEENPYQSPATPGNPGRTSTGRVVTAVVLGILTVPASAAAFFFSCLATLNLNEGALGVGAVCGLITLALMILATILVARGSRSKRGDGH